MKLGKEGVGLGKIGFSSIASRHFRLTGDVFVLDTCVATRTRRTYDAAEQSNESGLSKQRMRLHRNQACCVCGKVVPWQQAKLDISVAYSARMQHILSALSRLSVSLAHGADVNQEGSCSVFSPKGLPALCQALYRSMAVLRIQLQP